MGSYAIIGAHLCIANGAAWSAKLRGTDQVAVAFFGDGATNIGAFHEAVNYAANYRLGTIFVCENNLYMEYTPIAEVTPVKHPAADRAPAYGLDATIVDGNDADAVYLAAQAAIERARTGGGPSIIEAKTYRHGGHSRADPGQYRPDPEVEAWLEHDPIPMYHQRLLDLGVGEDRLTAIIRRSRPRSTGQPRRPRTRPSLPPRRSGPTCGRTGAPSGGTDLPGGGRSRHRPGDAPRPVRRVPRRGRGRGRGRLQDHRRLAGGVRTRPGGRHAHIRAGHPRCGHGSGDDRAAAHRRDHVLGLLRGVLGLRRQRDRQVALHDRRHGRLPAGDPVRQRRGLALRGPALAEHRELGHGRPRRQGGGAVHSEGPDRADGRLGPAIPTPFCCSSTRPSTPPRARSPPARSSTSWARPACCGRDPTPRWRLWP